MTPAQASATACACAIVFACMILCFNMGRYNAAVQIRSACDLDDREGLKAAWYEIQERR
jgi:hypothetical protein